MTILDDSQNPTVEGNETFNVYLNSVQKAKLSPPHEAVVIINDTLDDGTFIRVFLYYKYSLSSSRLASLTPSPITIFFIPYFHT